MQNIKIYAHAKVNLSLDAIKKRPDGYHEVRMIMQSIGICDELCVSKTPKDIILKTDNPCLPEDSLNIAWRAADLMKSKYGIKDGVRIELTKGIPVSAGLGGGSADAAAVMRAFDILFGLNLTDEELQTTALELGADVPFCLNGGTALAEGIGEKLTPLKSPESVPMVLVKPSFGVSTKEVYESLDINLIKKRPDTEKLIEFIEKNDVQNLAENMVNTLETVTISRYPIICDIKNMLREAGAAGSIMSGSGPAVFGIFTDQMAARKAYEKLSKNRLIKNKCKCWLTETL